MLVCKSNTSYGTSCDVINCFVLYFETISHTDTHSHTHLANARARVHACVFYATANGSLRALFTLRPVDLN